MRYFLGCLLLLSSCTNSNKSADPTLLHTYNQLIPVTGGFYKGYVLEIHSYTTHYSTSCPLAYEGTLYKYKELPNSNIIFDSPNITICSTELE